MISEDKNPCTFIPSTTHIQKEGKEKKSLVFFYYLTATPKMLAGECTDGGRHSGAFLLFIGHVTALFITIASSQTHLNNL